MSPGALVGSFKGSASQTRPIPPHVLDQEYDMVHQVGGRGVSGWVGGVGGVGGSPGSGEGSGWVGQRLCGVRGSRG
jgi:hypothetical protein